MISTILPITIISRKINRSSDILSVAYRYLSFYGSLVSFLSTKKTPESLRQPSNVLIRKASRAFSEFQFFTDKIFLTFLLHSILTSTRIYRSSPQPISFFYQWSNTPFQIIGKEDVWQSYQTPSSFTVCVAIYLCNVFRIVWFRYFHCLFWIQSYFSHQSEHSSSLQDFR